MSLLLTMLASDVPVDPDSPEARQWILDELSKPEYQQAKPTWFDQLAKSLQDWLSSLQIKGSGGPPEVLIAGLVVGIAAVLVVLFLIFGLPRINRRSSAGGALFGEDDDRTSTAMRRAAEKAAGDGDFTLAIAEMFRATARGLAERTVVTVSPGTTAHGFGMRASEAFPASAAALSGAADTFDGVRYLGVSGTRERYDELAELERTLRSARPILGAVSV